MPASPTTTRFPWATVVGWIGLLAGGVSAVGAVAAVVYAVEGARDPESWGGLAAAGILVYAVVPALAALTVGLVQARGGRAPRWRTRTTLVLASTVPALIGALVVVIIVGSLVS